MKKILVLLMIISLFVFFGCIEGMQNIVTGLAANSGGKGKPVPPPSETIQQILLKANTTTNLEYNLTIKLNGNSLPANIKVYQKNEKYRINSGTTSFEKAVIFDGTNLYNYDYASDEYSLSGIPADLVGVADFIFVAQQALNDSGLRQLKTQRINGFNTRIIEFSLQGQKAKAWISEDYGIPIKLEKSLKKDTLSVELSNLQFNSVNDAVFAVPA